MFSHFIAVTLTMQELNKIFFLPLLVADSVFILLVEQAASHTINVSILTLRRRVTALMRRALGFGVSKYHQERFSINYVHQ